MELYFYKMRKLKTYKLFENFQSNEDYITLAHLLYDLFDHWGIVDWTDETFGDMIYPQGPLNEGYPTHKFWTYRKTNTHYIKPQDLDKEVIKDITIWNIKVDESKEFDSHLEDVISKAQESIGRLIYISPELYDTYGEEFIDYTIKIK